MVELFFSQSITNSTKFWEYFPITTSMQLFQKADTVCRCFTLQYISHFSSVISCVKNVTFLYRKSKKSLRNVPFSGKSNASRHLSTVVQWKMKVSANSSTTGFGLFYMAGSRSAFPTTLQHRASTRNCILSSVHGSSLSRKPCIKI